MAGVSLNNVSKTYVSRRSRVDAVRDLSFEAQDGELLVLVGPSGCGKTTTLRLIAGLEEPTSGEIRIGERSVAGVAPRDRDVAMVFQNYALYPHMTVFDTMAFGLRMRKTPKLDIRRQVEETATMLGLSDLLRRRPAALSGGERQRVALGRAIVRKPQVFLLDEPLSNLDPTLRVDLRSEMRALQRHLGTTMIYVTHDQEEAMTLGDRVAVLQGGVLQQVAEPLTLYHQPANRFVAGFIGTPSMNFLEGRLKHDGSRRMLATSAGLFEVPAERAASLGEGEDGPVTVGIRPQHLYPIDPSAGGDAAAIPDGLTTTMELTVESVEALGPHTDLRVTTSAGEELTARVVPTIQAWEGMKVKFALDPATLHFFSATDGGRLG